MSVSYPLTMTSKTGEHPSTLKSLLEPVVQKNACHIHVSYEATASSTAVGLCLCPLNCSRMTIPPFLLHAVDGTNHAGQTSFVAYSRRRWRSLGFGVRKYQELCVSIIVLQNFFKHDKVRLSPR
ncbi:unnamed protein product [Cuscuta epithymum]|uniref:Uncharacterized protein n=1 Tax=Cuscuta epithymum TaxID=186058 RepID=A0AAV0EDE5_9ASTE|nr:unnamed protein product [Cuscuta epithymum]